MHGIVKQDGRCCKESGLQKVQQKDVKATFTKKGWSPINRVKKNDSYCKELVRMTAPSG